MKASASISNSSPAAFTSAHTVPLSRFFGTFVHTSGFSPSFLPRDAPAAPGGGGGAGGAIIGGGGGAIGGGARAAAARPDGARGGGGASGGRAPSAAAPSAAGRRAAAPPAAASASCWRGARAAAVGSLKGIAICGSDLRRLPGVPPPAPGVSRGVTAMLCRRAGRARGWADDLTTTASSSSSSSTADLPGVARPPTLLFRRFLALGGASTATFSATRPSDTRLERRRGLKLTSSSSSSSSQSHSCVAESCMPLARIAAISASMAGLMSMVVSIVRSRKLLAE